LFIVNGWNVWQRWRPSSNHLVHGTWIVQNLVGDVQQAMERTSKQQHFRKSTPNKEKTTGHVDGEDRSTATTTKKH
jgi:hypothetical protein